MNQLTEKEVYEECTRQIREITLQQQQKFDQQIGDFKAFINQQFLDFVASIDNFESKNDEISPENPPQSKHQQQTSSSFDTDNHEQDNVLLDLSYKPKKKEKSLPMDLTTNVFDLCQPLNLTNNSGSEQNKTAQQGIENQSGVAQPETETSLQLPKQLLPQKVSSSKMPLVSSAERVYVKQEPSENTLSLVKEVPALPPKLPQPPQPNFQTKRPIKAEKTLLPKISLVEYDDVSDSDSESLLEKTTATDNISPSTSAPSTSTAVFNTTLPSTSKQPNISFSLSRTNISSRSHKLINDDAKSDEPNEIPKKTVTKNSSKKENLETLKRKASPVQSSSKSFYKKEKRSRTYSRSRSSSRSRSYERNKKSRKESSSRSPSPNKWRKRSSSRRSRSRSSSTPSSLNKIFQNSSSDDTSDQQPPKYAQFLTKSFHCTQPKCFKKLNSPTQLNEHLEAKHFLTEPYKCPRFDKCKGRFSTREQLLQHQKVDHEVNNRWNCYQCSAFYLNPESFLLHVDIAHTLGDFLCSVKGCQNLEYTKEDAYDHFYSCHIQSKYGYKLKKGVVIRSKAMRKLASNNQLKAMPTFKNSNPKYKTIWEECTVVGCEEVSPKYGFKWLNEHLYDEHGLKHFRCAAKNCDSSFDDFNEWSFHGRRTHFKSDWSCSKKSCPYAGMELSNGTELNEHNVLFHQRGIFKCKFCSYSAKYRSLVIEHFDQEHSLF